MEDNHFILLGLGENASQDEVEEAFLRLVKKHHPDRGGDGKMFMRLKNAWDVLQSPNRRVQYLYELRSQRRYEELEEIRREADERFAAERERRLVEFRNRPWWMKLLRIFKQGE